MSKVYLEDSTLTSIANAIRAKTGGSSSITPANMPTEIGSISGGSGLNDDVRAIVENSNPTFSFTTYTSNGTQIDKKLAGSNLTDINMPNLRSIYAQIPVNNTIAARLESNSNLYNITASGVLYGSCDKLELIQSVNISYNTFSNLNCEYLAVPNGILSGNAYISDGNKIRIVYWPSDTGTQTGRPSTGQITATSILILTRTSSIVSLNSTSANYFNPDIKVYVPQSMLSSYQSATNWSTIASQIFAIENSEAILKGIFDELDRRYNWSGDLTLLQKLQRQKVFNLWQINLSELITIANDLADNEENSIYYPYKDGLIINNGLEIAPNVNLFITDTFKYQDTNGDLIPLSGLLTQRKRFISSSDGYTGLNNVFGMVRMNITDTNIGGFGESELYSRLNNPDGDLFVKLPTSLTDNLVEWKIENDYTALLAPPSEKEIFGTNTSGSSSYDIYNQLTFFSNLNNNNRAGTEGWWERSPVESDTTRFCRVYASGTAGNYGASNSCGLAPAFALGKKGVNNG
jgi:hypothetical protein